MTDSSIFDTLYKLLTEERPKRPKKTQSNLIDALSLTMLQEKLELHKREPQKEPLPIYYISSPKIYKAIKKYIQQNRKGHFYYETPEGRIPIIRDSEFFILDAIFNRSKNNSFESHFTGDNSDIKDDIRLLDENALLLEKVFDMNYDENFREKADSIINLNFFKKMWLENEGLDDVGGHLFKYYNEITESKEQLEKAVEEKKRELQGEFAERLSIIKQPQKTSKDLYDFEDKQILTKYPYSKIQLKNFVKKNEIQKCIEILIEISSEHNLSENDLFLIGSNLNDINYRNGLGTIMSDNYNVEFKKIKKALLEIIDEINPNA